MTGVRDDGTNTPRTRSINSFFHSEASYKRHAKRVRKRHNVHSI